MPEVSKIEHTELVYLYQEFKLSLFGLPDTQSTHESAEVFQSTQLGRKIFKPCKKRLEWSFIMPQGENHLYGLACQQPNYRYIGETTGWY